MSEGISPIHPRKSFFAKMLALAGRLFTLAGLTANSPTQ